MLRIWMPPIIGHKSKREALPKAAFKILTTALLIYVLVCTTV